MPVIVSGANGFVGGEICRQLLAANSPFVRLVRRPSGRFPEIVCDLATEFPTIPELQDSLSVVHSAAVLTESSERHFDDNVRMTHHLLESLPPDTACFVLISSVSVYDRSNTLKAYTLAEDSTAFANDGYGLSKLIQERRVEEWANKTGCRLVVLRPSSIIGVGCHEQTFLSSAVRAAVHNQPIELFAPRGYRQNFVAVADVGKAVLEALCGTMRGTFNVFSNDTLTAPEVIARVLRISGSQSEVVDRRPDTTVSGVYFDNRRFSREFTVQFSPFDETLHEMCSETKNRSTSTMRSE